MAIPRHDEIQFPALKLLSDGNQRKAIEFEAPLAKIFNLTDNEINQMYDSGNGPIFIDRVNWALSFLNMAGVVMKPKRGIYDFNLGMQSEKIIEIKKLDSDFWDSMQDDKR